MRVPRALAWTLVVLALLTAGLLRQFHDHIPRSPYVPPLVGSLLFAAIFLLLLVSAWERRRGAVPGPGVRLGSLTPLVLMLFVEKWVSLGLYNPVFFAIAPEGLSDAALDARWRAFAGLGLLLVSLLVGTFSAPAARFAWSAARPRRWPAAAAAVGAVVVATYALLGLLSRALGGGLELEWPPASSLVAWTVAGQATLAFAEEVYYRGLVLGELRRLAPRLGLRRRAGGRWLAVIGSSVVFALEHLRLSSLPGVAGRRMVFAFALAVLFGMLVLVTRNLHFSAGLHAWINLLLLGAAPRFVDGAGVAVLPAGTYIGVGLILGFCAAAIYARRALARPAGG